MEHLHGACLLWLLLLLLWRGMCRAGQQEQQQQPQPAQPAQLTQVAQVAQVAQQ